MSTILSLAPDRCKRSQIVRAELQVKGDGVVRRLPGGLCPVAEDGYHEDGTQGADVQSWKD